MQKNNNILIMVALTLNSICTAQSKWSWTETKSEQNHQDFHPREKADREREPTTKRPLPGQPQNDDIDDYTDTSDEDSKQNSPYLPPGVIGHPLNAGNYNGFGNYPQFTGNLPNGILVGPRGPIGGLQHQFPPSNFPALQGGYPSYPLPHHFSGNAGNNNPGFANYNGFNSAPGQYPFAHANNNAQQFGGAQYTQSQFPNVQYSQQPQYTEGYGLPNLNTGFNGNLQFNGNLNPNYGFDFDTFPEPLQADKSPDEKSINKKLDDKVTKNLKKL